MFVFWPVICFGYEILIILFSLFLFFLLLFFALNSLIFLPRWKIKEVYVFLYSMYSVGNLKVPQVKSYLLIEMEWNLVAPISALPQQNLDSRVANERCGYGLPPIRLTVRMAHGWLGWRWIYFDRKLAKKPSIFQWKLKIFEILSFSVKSIYLRSDWLDSAGENNKVAVALWLAGLLWFRPIRALPPK